MTKIISKFVLPIVSMVFVLCLLAPTVLGSPAHMVTAQEPVTKNGAYFDVVEFANNGRSAAKVAEKITANNAKCDILYYGGDVGNFVFNKHNDYIEIEITEHVAVEVMWHCSGKEARCTLKGEGVYKLPQLLQDNGKTEAFDAIWIQSVNVHDPTDLPYFIEGSIAAMAERYGATDSEIAAMRAQWAEQIAIKMERIKETNGAVMGSSATTRATTAYMGDFIRTEDMGGGATSNHLNVLGAPDGRVTRFYTKDPNQAASVVATATVATTGDVYCTGYRSSSTTGQYAIVWGSTTGQNGTWGNGSGYTKISTTSSSDHYVGYTGTAYSYIAVGCNTYMGGVATYNEFHLDCVKIVKN